MKKIEYNNGKIKDTTKDIHKWSDEDLVRNYINNRMLYKMADKGTEVRYQNRFVVCRIEMNRRGIHKNEYGEFYKNV